MSGLDEALAGLAALDGVAGAVVCRDDGSVAGSAPAGLLAREPLERTAAAIARLRADLAALPGLAPTAIDLACSEGRLFLLPVGGGVVGLLCVAGTNPALLRLRSRLALRTIEGELARPTRAERAPLPRRLAGRIERVLGAQATRPLALLGAAGDDPARLAEAVTQIARFTRLFVDAEIATALESELRRELANP